MALAAGTRLGPYEVLDSLGAGGMGEVYRARDTRLGREVAVKVLPAKVAQEPRALERFELEARAVAALAHPNILALYDIGNEEGLGYAVTELLEGQTLRERLESDSLTTSRALGLAVEIAHGLAAAHDKGIVHRDLKPENIFVTRDGRAKILDFGLAKWSDRRASTGDGATLATLTQHTQPGSVMGTIGYMSPEQARGHESDHRSDIFSFGTLLHEMLYGTRAFPGDSSADILSAILREDPAMPPSSNSSVPQVLESIVRRCLEKDVGERFQSVRDLSFALEAISDSRPDEPSASPPPTEPMRGVDVAPSIAVLPFRDLSPKRDQEYFCEGMAEEILNAMTQIGGLRVASRSSAFHFKDQAHDTRHVGQALNVTMLLDGSVKTAGDQLRVTAQLINVEDGFNIWSERYDRNMKDVFAVQDEISASIAEVLRGQVGGAADTKPSKRQTHNLEAYHLYLKGQHNWYRREVGSLEKAAAFFEQATRKDPSYTLAYAGLANAYSSLGFYGLDPDVALAKAQAAIDRATELEPDLAEVHAARALIQLWLEWDFERAESSLQRSIEFNAEAALARCWYSFLLSFAHRYDEAVSMITEALEIDPLSPYANTCLGLAHFVAGKNEEALPALGRALEMESDFLFTHWVLGGAYSKSGRHDEAIATMERATSLSGRGSYYLGWLAYTYGAAGERGLAEEILAELELRAAGQYVSAMFFAWGHAGLGNKEAALDWLEKAYDERNPLISFLNWPLLDNLRSEPRFKALLEQANIPHIDRAG